MFLVHAALRITVLVILAVTYALPGLVAEPIKPEPPQVSANQDLACIFARGRARRRDRRESRRAYRVGFGC